MELYRADRQLRRMAVLAIVGIALLGAVALWALQSWLGSIAEAARGSTRARLAVLACVIGASLAPLSPLAIYLWRHGARTRAASQFPPPGARVLRDTQIVRGARAQRRGLWLQAMAVAIALACVGLAAAAWRFLAVFTAHAP